MISALLDNLRISRKFLASIICVDLLGIKNVTAAQIYEHLDTMYNMEAVEELENASPHFSAPPQPPRKLTLKDDEDEDDSDDSEDDDEDAGEEGFVEFSLPHADFSSTLQEMRKAGKISGSPGEASGDTPEVTNPGKKGAKEREVEPETPKSAQAKRPTRNTPSSTPAKRRK